ncbi:DUF3489 domain-containing protein [Tsuneonella sp. HG094]
MTSTTSSPARKRRMAREPQGAAVMSSAATKPPTRLDMLERLLTEVGGTTIAAMVEATGWQQHSVRGAMAGALKKKRSLVITSEKVDGVRRYRASKPA